MTMTLDLAKRILEAFGPCTTLYECNTAGELVADFEAFRSRRDGGHGSEDRDLLDFVKTLVRVEGIHLERGAPYTEDDKRHKAYWDAANATEKRISESIKELFPGIALN